MHRRVLSTADRLGGAAAARNPTSGRTVCSRNRYPTNVRRFLNAPSAAHVAVEAVRAVLADRDGPTGDTGLAAVGLPVRLRAGAGLPARERGEGAGRAGDRGPVGGVRVEADRRHALR